MRPAHWILVSVLVILVTITAAVYASLYFTAQVIAQAPTQSTTQSSTDAATGGQSIVQTTAQTTAQAESQVEPQADAEEQGDAADTNGQGDGAGDARGEPASVPGSLRAMLSEGVLTINETVPLLAGVEVRIGDDTHVLSLPATLTVDAQAALGAPGFAAADTTRVGILRWKIQEIEEHDSEYAVSQFTTVTASSPANKLVVVHSQATNLGREPFNFTRGLRDEFAYDAVGNLYGSTRRSCDDINPGATALCTLIFDVPADVTIVGLDLAVVDYKRIPLQELDD